MLAGIYQVGVFYPVYSDKFLQRNACFSGYRPKRIARAHDIKFSRHSGAGYRELISRIYHFAAFESVSVFKSGERDAELPGYRYRRVSAPDGVYFFAAAARWQSYSQPLAREYPVGINYPVLPGYRLDCRAIFPRYRPERVASADIYRERPCSRADGGSLFAVDAPRVGEEYPLGEDVAVNVAVDAADFALVRILEADPLAPFSVCRGLVCVVLRRPERIFFGERAAEYISCV